MELISWKRYDDEHKLSEILTAAARACVDARAARPIEYLATHFTQRCTGDEIHSISTQTVYLPNGVHALRFVLRLLNGMEVQSSAIVQSNHSEGVDAADDSVDPAIAAMDALKESCIPQLRKCATCDQRHFDEVLQYTGFNMERVEMGPNVVYGLSILAAGAAARCTTQPIFQYLRKLMDPPYSKEIFAMPQLCIKFFGPENMSTARLALKDVFLIPAMPNGSVRREVIRKIFAAFRHFSQVHNAATRSDGSLAYNGLESLTEALSLSEEAVRAVGLTPVEDVCIGLSMGLSVVAAAGTSSVTATAGTGGGGGKDQKDSVDVMYSLFPGDVDVSGAQIAEYMHEQLKLRTDFVVYLEDTHCGTDASGLRRLQSRLGGSLTVSGQAIYGHAQYQNLDQGLRDMWTSNVIVDPSAVGTLSDVYNIVHRVQAYEGRSVGFKTQDLVENAPFVAHLSVGLGARFVCMGGLLSISQCEVLSHLLCIQDELQQAGTLRSEAPQLSHMELPELPTEAVPGIKRRMEKKKRKK